jgi:uncharacterized SAM-binding protein YcdF (DUF218 family)
MSNPGTHRFTQALLRVLKWYFGIIGVFAFMLFILSFTDLPYNAYHRLGTSNSGLDRDPDVIVLLGGSGMPTPDGLMRTWYAAEAARKYPDARIIIAHPVSRQDSLKQLELMADELIVKGIDSLRITFEPLGFNTHSQALNIAEMLAGAKDTICLLLVTSPEHMYRAVRSFRKAGFRDVGGVAAFEKPVDEGQVSDKSKSGDVRVKSISLRYNMWSYLVYELLVMKEYTAIAYYKLKGWI